MCESSIKVDNKYSEYFTLERGVKQGDSLSPTLFNCFINDLHEIFDNSCDQLELEKSFISSLSFADDLIIFSETHQGLQTALNKLQEYCYNWQLTVNTNKTKIMIFQKKKRPLTSPPFFYDGKTFTEVNQYIFLGTVINSKGCFKSGIQELSKRGYS